jgi:hypothetical protein
MYFWSTWIIASMYDTYIYVACMHVRFALPSVSVGLLELLPVASSAFNCYRNSAASKDTFGFPFLMARRGLDVTKTYEMYLVGHFPAKSGKEQCESAALSSQSA